MGNENRWQSGHPLDEPLQDRTVLSWFVPTIELVFRRALVLAPFAAAMALYVWLLPRLSLAGPFDPAWLFHVDGILRTAVVSAVLVSGFCMLARAEGGPWGHGALVRWQPAVVRVALLVVFWYALSWLLSVIVSEVLSVPWLMHFFLRAINAMGMWGVYLLVSLIMPLPLMLGTVQLLSFVHAVRSDEPLAGTVLTSFALVFGQPGRFVLPFMLITFVICVIFHLIVRMEPVQLMLWLARNATAVMVVLSAIGTAITLAWWFVAERALRPELGLDPDAGFDADDDLEFAGGDGAGSALGSAVVATGNDATNSNDPVDLAQQLVELEAEAGPVMVARRLVAWLRGRRLAPADYPAVRDALVDTSGLAPQLVGLALEWRDFSRPGELPFVIAEGLRLDRAFLMNLPGEVLATAKRLGIQDQHELAARLLLPFLDRHKAHDDHAEAGVQMARILAFHRGKPEAGLRLLRQLATVHPEHPAIAAMIRQLEH